MCLLILHSLLLQGALVWVSFGSLHSGKLGPEGIVTTENPNPNTPHINPRVSLVYQEQLLCVPDSGKPETEQNPRQARGLAAG